MSAHWTAYMYPLDNPIPIPICPPPPRISGVPFYMRIPTCCTKPMFTHGRNPIILPWRSFVRPIIRLYKWIQTNRTVVAIIISWCWWIVVQVAYWLKPGPSLNQSVNHLFFWKRQWNRSQSKFLVIVLSCFLVWTMNRVSHIAHSDTQYIATHSHVTSQT